MMKVYSYSGKGNRETNEDYIKSESFSNNVSLHIVADGIGGYQFGEVASQVATDAIVQFISERHSDSDITSTIQQAIEFANEEIVLKQKALHAKLGTTIAGVFIRESVAYAFWLGDVQIQHFRDNQQLFISESHSLINDLKKHSVISAKDIERYNHIVTRSLFGSPLDAPIPIVEIQLRQADTICISSDGLYNSINPATLITNSDIETEALLQENEVSNEDNLSITIITI
jgi:serine/threonine protein phosphatase PrpC